MELCFFWCLHLWNLENPMVIHGKPPPWRKRTNFVGPNLDFEGSLYNHHSLIDRPLNFDMDDELARWSEKLLRNMYHKTHELLKKHHSALLKSVKLFDGGASVATYNGGGAPIAVAPSRGAGGLK